MPVEVATSIEDLDTSWPLGGDVVDRGDDHLRLIKSVLQVQFPGVAGNGFAIPITATEVEINFLTGLTSNAQAQLTALDGRITGLEGVLSASPGTRMAFHQAAAPTGWTQDVTLDNHMLRVVATAGGGNGGTDSPIAAHIHTTGDISLSIAQMPIHNHETDIRNTSQGVGGGSGTGTRQTITATVSTSQGGGEIHNHGATGTSFTPKYVDMIIASKD